MASGRWAPPTEEADHCSDREQDQGDEKDDLCRFDGEGRAHVDGSLVRHAQVVGPGADVFATSLALLNLQAPYRYVPLRQ